MIPGDARRPSLPDKIQADLNTNRVVDVEKILFKVTISFQPGGLEEKQALTKKLTEGRPAGTAQEAVETLRRWERHKARAVELAACSPPAET